MCFMDFKEQELSEEKKISFQQFGTDIQMRYYLGTQKRRAY